MQRLSFVAPPLPEADFVFAEAILWAGDLVAGSEPVRMSTVLGSCVAVCLFDPVRRLGGMNHYLVPRGGKALIHGDWATAQLIDRMRQLGSKTANLQAKVFGGGTPLRLANESFAVGADNVTVAREVLASHGVPIVAERVGHGAGIRIFFESWTGVVWLRAHEETQRAPRTASPRPPAGAAAKLSEVTEES